MSEHYKQHPSGVECITVAQHFNFNVGNAIKYLWRHGLKEGNPALVDIKKARTYIDFEIARLEQAAPSREEVRLITTVRFECEAVEQEARP